MSTDARSCGSADLYSFTEPELSLAPNGAVERGLEASMVNTSVDEELAEGESRIQNVPSSFIFGQSFTTEATLEQCSLRARHLPTSEVGRDRGTEPPLGSEVGFRWLYSTLSKLALAKEHEYLSSSTACDLLRLIAVVLQTYSLTPEVPYFEDGPRRRIDDRQLDREAMREQAMIGISSMAMYKESVSMGAPTRRITRRWRYYEVKTTYGQFTVLFKAFELDDDLTLCFPQSRGIWRLEYLPIGPYGKTKFSVACSPVYQGESWSMILCHKMVYKIRDDDPKIFKVVSKCSEEDMLEMVRSGDMSVRDCDPEGRSLLRVKYLTPTTDEEQ